MLIHKHAQSKASSAQYELNYMLQHNLKYTCIDKINHILYANVPTHFPQNFTITTFFTSSYQK